MSVAKLVGVVRTGLESRATRQAVIESRAASDRYLRKFRTASFLDPRFDMFIRVSTASGIAVVCFGRRLIDVAAWRECVRDQAVCSHGNLLAFTRETGAVAYSTLYGWIFGERCPRLSQARTVTLALGGSITVTQLRRGARLESYAPRETG
ncbi:MAG: hypothetical protein KC468_22650 [Myxococcales bacterium]|nr:hypothetical protein [Myxococcales bacterium]